MDNRFLMLACASLAFLFTFSCSSNGNSEGNSYSSSSSSEANSSPSDCTDYDPNAEVEHYGKTKMQICDERDGKRYAYIIIGGKTWMSENLNYATSGSKCYNNDPANCAKYGRLYNWVTAMTVCPSGWHLPSDDEWNALIYSVGGDSMAGRHLKATSGWNSNISGNGLDTYGFSALPGGHEYSNDKFYDVSYSGYWWSSNDSDSGAYIRCMSYYRESLDWNYYDKSYMFSVRCVQDAEYDSERSEP
jgi:uncharacterized protein (TIGR02145 family)